MSNQTVRPYSRDDLAECLWLGQQVHEESALADFTWNPDKLVALSELAENNKNIGAFVLEEDGLVVGFMIGIVNPHYFTDDLIASDLILYIHPGHRSRGGAVRLVAAFEKWAFSRGVKAITLGISTGILVEQTSRLYTRLGYARSGVTFTKRM